MSKFPKIAIIGAGPAGLACALECEKLGVIPHLFDSGETVGWEWPSVILLLNILEVPMGGNIREYIKDIYKIDIQPISPCTELIMKSPNKQTKITGNLGFFYSRGKRKSSLENQLLNMLINTPVFYNRPADYKELSQNYDYVVVATGNEKVAKELGVWEEYGQVHIWSALTIGQFKTDSTTIYFNTDYAGEGYARLTPFDSFHAIVDLYNIGKDKFETDKLYNNFIAKEGLSNLEIKYQMLLPPFSTGKVKKFQVNNIMLAGRTAGLTERLTGTGAIAALGSGIFAARAIIKNKDYETLVKPLQAHIENVSAFRKIMEKLDNNGLDKMVAITDTPGIKQLMYNTRLNFLDIVGTILKKVM
ncbi:FAD-dependent oxidoreductase [Desulforamulus aquiferis]|uniref:FAD-dependent oxidoreductase n=1 Tax=Desulforamulus aquiferis TaxID=1397668 RepID=A0AAW7ZAK6_9FIRM|nr:FAD-dependent oxidoreductase [Desulforamulus aquiferis]MDO7786445.1 FAD-dependent oxidoreductase [Desulforamulus aquiferis]RYD02557.1 hypothetical protein N752_24830 [Desulforamulus aquiferis]